MKEYTAIVLCISLFTMGGLNAQDKCYSSDYVEISKVTYNDDEYSVVSMKRKDDRVKAKYFAAKDDEGNSVHNRYLKWKKKNPNSILVSSGTYMDDYNTPQGLTIDNGKVVNSTLIQGRMDALVIVYATGGIAVSNLNEKNLSVSGGGITSNRQLDIRGSSKDLYDFKKWAEDQEATVFQTHLLVYRGELQVGQSNSNKTKRERRFLAVGADENGDIVHIIVHRPKYASLYESSKKTLDFLYNYKYIDVIFMINLDTGYQDVFELYNSNCSTNSTIKGELPLNRAVNLLVYHFK